MIDMAKVNQANNRLPMAGMAGMAPPPETITGQKTAALWKQAHPTGTTGGTTYPTGTYGGVTGVQNPPEWDIAGRTLAGLAQGIPQAQPSAWGTVENIGTQMAQTGMPTPQTEWYQRAKGVAETDITDAIKQAAEQAGLRGARWSTPLGRTAQDIAGRTMANVGLEWTGRELEAQEQARARQLSALSQLYGLGTGQVGLGENALNRALQAAGGLGTLGQRYAQLPMDVAQQAFNQGLAMMQARQAQLSPIYQEFLRRTPEASPWLQYGFQATQMPFQMTQQQYQPSGLTSGLGILGSLIPFLGLLG